MITTDFGWFVVAGLGCCFACEIAWKVIIKPQLIKRAARQGKNMYSDTWFSSFRH